MSSIMKGIVDEGEEVAVIYIDGKPSAKYAKKHEAERDAEFMRKRHPNKKIEIKHEVRETEEKSSPYKEGYKAWKDYLAGKTKQRPVNPYPAGKGMGAWEQGAGDAAEHIDWGEGPLGETEAKKGAGEVVKKVFKHKGKPVGEIGVDLASSPGGGMYYMKYYGSGRAVSGYDSMEEAFAVLKHYLNQMKEGATGETESILVNEFMDTDNKFGRGDGGNEPIPVYHSKKPNKVIGYVYKDEYGWNSEAVNSELGHSHIDSKLEAIQDVHEMYNEWVHQKKYSKLINGRWTTIPAPDDAYSDPPKNEGAIGETESMPVTETKWEVAIEYGPTAHHTTKIKVSAPDADTAQTKALSIFKKKFPDRRGMVGDCTQIKEAANAAQQAAIAINMKKKGKKPKNVEEASGTPGGVEMFRTKDMVNTTMQQNLYRKELQAVKDAEKKRKQAEYRKNKPRESVPTLHIGASSFPIPTIQDWIDNKDVDSAIKFVVNKFANKQTPEFKSALAADDNFKDAVINFFEVGADNLAARNAFAVNRRTGRVDSDYRTPEQTSAGYDAINRINDVLLTYMKKYGVDKTGRRVPPGFNYTLGEGVIVGHDAKDPEVAILGGAGTMSLSRLKKKAHQEALQLADDIANGKYSASSYNMKQLHNTLNTIVAAEKEMEKSYFGEAVDWQRGENNNEHDHTLKDAEEYLTHLYPVVKKYMIRRAEVGFRAGLRPNEKEFMKSMSHMKDVDAVIKYLGLNKLPTMSGSKQATSSIGYTWTTFLSPNKKAAIIYYQDRGMGQDMIYIAAADKALHRKIYDLFVDAGVIVGRDKKVKEPELPQGMRVSGATSRDDAYNRAMNKFLGKNDDDGVNEDYTGEFAAEKTPAVNPYGGLKDRKFRGAISETPTDNPTGASGEGGWRKYKPKSAGTVEEAKKSQFRQQSEQQQLEKLEKIANSSLPHWAKEYLTLLNDPRGKVFKAGYYSFSKGQAAREEVAQYIMNKYKVPQHMLDKVKHGEMAHVAMDRPEDRNYDFDVPSVHEDTAYAGGMGQGHSGESYRKFKPKSAGTFKESACRDCKHGYPADTCPECEDEYKEKHEKKKQSAIMKGIKGRK